MASSALAKAEAKIASLKARAASMRDEYADTIEEVVGVVSGMGAGFAFGAAEQKWGEDAIMGAGIPVVVGVPATVAALAGFGGGARKVLLEVGKAGLIVESYKGGSRVARDWLEENDEEEGADARG